jgi:arsenate reductase
MTKPIIYHHPRCSKSRQALGLLEASGKVFELVESAKDPLSQTQLSDLQTKLKLSLREMIRSGEHIYKELHLDQADDATLLAAIVAHPILLQRPIIVCGDKAVIGRPPEKLHDIL